MTDEEFKEALIGRMKLEQISFNRQNQHVQNIPFDVMHNHSELFWTNLRKKNYVSIKEYAPKLLDTHLNKIYDLVFADGANTPAPSKEELIKYVKKWSFPEHKIEKDNDAALTRLFAMLPYEEDDLHTIMIKVTILNSMFSAQIIKTYDLAKHIFNNRDRIAEALKHHSYDAVEIIRSYTMILKDSNEEVPAHDAFSFATKYCHFFRAR